MIGPTFEAELKLAGLYHLPLSWSSAGVQYGENFPANKRADVQAVIQAHDPTKQPVPRKQRRDTQLDGATTLDELKAVLKTVLDDRSDVWLAG